jgi:DNA polymerase eta
MVPRGELEKASIDEAFMDLTPMVVERLLERFAYLRSVPPDAPDGLDSPLPPAPPIDWGKAGHVVPVDMGGEPEEGEGEGRPEEEATWGDWALCLGAEIMADVRAEVWRRLHYTCSAVSCRKAGRADNRASRTTRLSPRSAFNSLAS